MDELLKYWSIITVALAAAFGFVATWTRMTAKLADVVTRDDLTIALNGLVLTLKQKDLETLEKEKTQLEAELKMARMDAADRRDPDAPDRRKTRD